MIPKGWPLAGSGASAGAMGLNPVRQEYLCKKETTIFGEKIVVSCYSPIWQRISRYSEVLLTLTKIVIG